MASLSLRLFGAPQIALDGQPLVLVYTKGHALLAYLALQAGQAHSRDALGSLLWPDLSRARARANLRLVLSNLREVLPSADDTVPFVQTTRDTIVFNSKSDYELDVDVFRTLLAVCAKHPHRALERCHTCVMRLEQAMATYTGEFLEGLVANNNDSFNEWIRTHSQRFHQQAMDALATLSSFHLRCGQEQQALIFLYRLLELEPWQEEAHQELMRLYARAGKRSSALAQYHRCRQVLSREFQIEPLPETTALYEHIRRGKILPKHIFSRQTYPSASLPVPATPLIGRDAELVRLSDLLCNPACHIITILGPGGIGKTRLALAAGSAHGPLFLDGVAFVSLAAVSSDASIVSAIADALGISRYGADDPKAQILAYLRGKELLLIIDNAEHMLASMSFLAELAAAMPPLVLLVTSRARLQLRDEWIMEIQGLSYPSARTVSTHSYDSVLLFKQIAERVRGVALPPRDLPWVAEICQFVEGTPLAIELAAAWTRSLSCEVIASNLNHDIASLSTPFQDMPERHRTMGAVFEHSWSLLTSSEQQILRRVAVFQGGFTAVAAIDVAGATPLLLAALVDVSLVRRDDNQRYELHELIRQLAVLKLQANDTEHELVRDQHAAYYLALLARHKPNLQGPRIREALAEITAEIANVRLAWHRSLEQANTNNINMAKEALWQYFDFQGWFAEGEATYQQLAARLQAASDATQGRTAKHDTQMGHAIGIQGWFCGRQGRLEEGRELMLHACALLRQGEMSRELGEITALCGITCFFTGRYTEARGLILHGLAFARRLGDRWYEAISLGNLGLLALAQGKYRRAACVMQAGVAMIAELGAQRHVAIGKTCLSSVASALGAYERAHELLYEGVAISRELSDPWNVANGLVSLQELAYVLGKHADVRSYHVECASLCVQINDRHLLARSLNIIGRTAYVEGLVLEAQSYFHEALAITQELGLTPVALDVLVGIATIMHDEEQDESARELLMLVLHHPASRAEISSRARDLLVLWGHLSLASASGASFESETSSFDSILARILNARKFDGIFEDKE
jgi:DNA-binding SARP family transcriptional activator/predicted ATPase